MSKQQEIEEMQSQHSSKAYVPPHRRRREATSDNSRGAVNENRVTSSLQRQRANDSSQYNKRQNKSTRGDNHQQQSRNFQRRVYEIPQTRICCINLVARTDKWKSVVTEARRAGGDTFCRQIERFNAVDGRQWRLHHSTSHDAVDSNNSIQTEWDATQNAQYSHRVTPGLRTMTDGEIGCALSHVELWKLHVNNEKTSRPYMLILEDDCAFCAHRGRTRFPRALEKTFHLLPDDWGILYLGFSSRGPRNFINDVETESSNPIDDPPIQLYQPTYGFHTHAYMITKAAAARLLEALPVTGPIDVWLADNQWFGIPTYCSVIVNEGWYNETEEKHEGANLVGQKKHQLSSDVDQSAHNDFRTREFQAREMTPTRDK